MNSETARIASKTASAPGSASLPIFTLMDKIGWFGSHTGYEVLPRYLPPETVQVHRRPGRWPRAAGKLYSLTQGWPARDQAATFSELELHHRWRRTPGAIAHALYGEEHLRFFTRWPRAPRSWVATVHQPPSQWSDVTLAQLRHVQSAIVLYQRDLGFFGQIIGQDRVRFIHHGVDVDFFTPGIPAFPARLLYNGVHLRNVEMFARTVEAVNARHPEVRIDALVPAHRRTGPVFENLLVNPSITWHAGLDDEQLRALYRRSFLLLLPMNDSGANTAVVEALACGLPIVTTDVGGIRNYGGDSIFPVVANGDDDAMLALVEQYLSNTAWRDEIAARCRRFAEEVLAWPLVAQRHLAVYRELLA